MTKNLDEYRDEVLQAIRDCKKCENLPEDSDLMNERQYGIKSMCRNIQRRINKIPFEKDNQSEIPAPESITDKCTRDVNNSVAELVAKEVESIMENDQAKENPPETTESKTIEDILNVAEKLGNAIIETMTWYRLKQNREDEIEEQEKREAAEFHEQKIKEYLAIASEMKKSRHEQEALDKTEKEEAHNFIKKLMGRRM